MNTAAHREARAEFERFVHYFTQSDSWLRNHPPLVQWDLHGPHFPPMNTPIDHPLVRSLVQNREALGLKADIKGFIAVCDAADYAGAGAPGVIHGPSGNGLHGADEFVDIESVVQTAKVIAATAIDWCGLR